MEEDFLDAPHAARQLRTCSRKPCIMVSKVNRHGRSEHRIIPRINLQSNPTRSGMYQDYTRVLHVYPDFSVCVYNVVHQADVDAHLRLC
jgi:hypothetical protein